MSVKKKLVTEGDMTEEENCENGLFVKTNNLSQNNFPWAHYFSLSMHNLMTQWKVQPFISEKPSLKVYHIFICCVLFIPSYFLVKLYVSITI